MRGEEQRLTLSARIVGRSECLLGGLVLRLVDIKCYEL